MKGKVESIFKPKSKNNNELKKSIDLEHFSTKTYLNRVSCCCHSKKENVPRNSRIEIPPNFTVKSKQIPRISAQQIVTVSTKIIQNKRTQQKKHHQFSDHLMGISRINSGGMLQVTQEDIQITTAPSSTKKLQTQKLDKCNNVSITIWLALTTSVYIETVYVNFSLISLQVLITTLYVCIFIA